MARKRGSDDDRKRRAMHAAMNDRDGKRKGRSLSSDEAAELARRRWRAWEEKQPEVTLEDIARVQAARSPAARRRDAMNTSASVIDPRSKRAILWLKDPLHHDLLGIDTEPSSDVKPTRPPRPGADAPRHGERKIEPEKTRKRPRRKPEDRAPAKAPEPAPEPELAPEPEPEPAKTQKKPEPAPAEAPEKSEKDPEPSQEPPPDAGDEAPPVVLYRDHADEALELASWKPPEMGAVPETLRQHEADLSLRLARLVSKDEAEAKRAAEYELERGGFLTSDDRRITVFDRNARRLDGGDAANLASKLRIPVRASLSGQWRAAPRDRVNIDLARYLHELDAPPGTKFVPIRDELFRLKDVEALARALPGAVGMDVIKDGHLVVHQGNRIVAVKPASRAERKEHSRTAQAIIRKGKNAPPRSPGEAALMEKVPEQRHPPRTRKTPTKKTPAKQPAKAPAKKAPAKSSPVPVVVPPDTPTDQMVTIRALGDIPPFVGPDKQTRTFRQGDLAMVPSGVAKLLEQRSKAEVVQPPAKAPAKKAPAKQPAKAPAKKVPAKQPAKVPAKKAGNRKKRKQEDPPKNQRRLDL